jgi:protein-disulfide isomerase
MLGHLASLVRQCMPARVRSRRAIGLVVVTILLFGGLFYKFGGSSWHASPVAHVTLEPAGNVRGSPGARIEIVEYTALDCLDCARFEKDVFRQLVSRYVDTGLAKFTLRNFASNDAAREAAAIARCVRQDDYFAFIDLLFRRRYLWTANDAPHHGLLRLAGLAGLSPDKAEACLADSEIMRNINSTTEQARNLYGMATVPILVINGQVLHGPLDWPDVQQYLDRVTSRH